MGLAGIKKQSMTQHSEVTNDSLLNGSSALFSVTKGMRRKGGGALNANTCGHHIEANYNFKFDLDREINRYMDL